MNVKIKTIMGIRYISCDIMKLVILWLQTPVNAVIHGKKKIKMLLLENTVKGRLIEKTSN